MIRPMPTIRRKAKNGMNTGGRSSGGKVSNPISRAVQVPEAMKLPSFGTSIANRLRSRASSGMAISTSVAGCWRVPARLDRGEFGRLMMEDVIAGQMAEEQLHRDDHRDQPQAPVQHDPRFGRCTAAQQIPGAGCDNAHAGGQEGGEQHMRPAHQHDRPGDDRPPVGPARSCRRRSRGRAAPASSCCWRGSRTRKTSCRATPCSTTRSRTRAAPGRGPAASRRRTSPRA